LVKHWRWFGESMVSLVIRAFTGMQPPMAGLRDTLAPESVPLPHNVLHQIITPGRSSIPPRESF
jgi:hypothetical protein